MLDSLNEISKQPVVILLYNGGASGEFLAHALTQTVDQFSKTQTSWENNNRCIFGDYFGRTLICGPVDHKLLLSRVNLYHSNLQIKADWHLGLAHKELIYLEFLQTWGSEWPVIEITTADAVSAKFQQLAQNHKISQQDILTQENLLRHSNVQMSFGDFRPKKHLKVEWKQLMLTNTKNTYLDLVGFLGGSAQVEKFLLLVDDYKKRNQNFIDMAYES